MSLAEWQKPRLELTVIAPPPIYAPTEYKTLYVDPMWQYKVWSKDTGSGRSAASHYLTAGMDYMKALPINQIAAKDSTLLMWATWPQLPDALALGEAWGFKYRTCGFLWAKLNKRWFERLGKAVKTAMVKAGKGDQYSAFFDEFQRLFFFGMGYWTRANTEPCLLFTKGNPHRIAKNVRQLVVSPIGRHSEKPHLYNSIERLVDGPYIEIFARNLHASWTSVGNEIDGQLAHEALPQIAGGSYVIA